MTNAKGTPTLPEYVCIHFCRAPESLIEESEVCENCAHWQEGFCFREQAEDRG